MVKVIISLAVVFNVVLLSVRQYPGLLLLVEPGVNYRNPSLCSTGQAVSGVKVKLQQQRAMKQILSESKLLKTDHGLDLWQTPGGSYWVRSGPPELLPTLLAQERRDIYGDQTWGVHPGDIVLDCGAHVGTFTRRALAAGAKLVVAIEPAPAAVECLRRNFASEISAGRVIVYPKGVWDREDTLTFFTDNNADAGDSFVVSHHASGVVKIPVTTIDNLARELSLPRVDFIKMDVKGSTEKAIQGGANVITTHRPRMALSTEEVVDNPETLVKAVRTLVPGYETRCGPCLLDVKEVYLDVLFFR